MQNRIALGTAQIGLEYGISNQQGQVDPHEAARMLAFARERGVDTIDTAPAYGGSELVLGEIGLSGLRIFSKLPGLPADTTDIEGWVRRSVEASLSRLRVERLTGLLMHRPADLLGCEGHRIYCSLEAMCTERLIEKIGYSIYDPNELDDLVSRFPASIVQAPFNVFDQRLLRSGWLQRLRAASIEVHTRSAFLQGLLLMEDAARPRKFDRWQREFGLWSEWRKRHRVTAVQAALSHSLRNSDIGRVVVGATSVAELREILTCRQDDDVSEFEGIDVQDLDLIDPSRWSRL